MKSTPLFDLNATELSPGTCLIEASAGTGKTYTIAGLVVRLLLELDIPIEKILVVTFTEAATEELRSRIRQEIVNAREAFRTGESKSDFLRALCSGLKERAAEMIARLDLALGSFDQASIFTIHGFCQRMLKDRAFESGALFDTELVPDQSDIWRELAEDFWRREFYEASPVVVNSVLSAGLKPAEFLPLLKSWLSHPSLKVVTSLGSRSHKLLAKELEETFTELGDVWKADHVGIRALFGSSQTWCLKEYKDDDRMALRFAALESCFDGSGGSPASFKVLNEFTPEALASEVRKNASAPQHRFFDLCAELQQRTEDFLVGLQLAFLTFAQDELPRRKEHQKVQSFDDLITRLGRALDGAGKATLIAAIRGKFSAALIDEFQDTDPTQYEIFRRVFDTEQHRLFLIGDPKQAIYGFRGADVFAYIEAERETKRQHTLGKNFRSEAALVTAVNTVFGSAENPFVIDGIDFHPVAASDRAEKEPLRVGGRREPPLQIWFHPRDGEREIAKGAANDAIPRAVAAEIARLLNGDTKIGERKLRPEDIAVLVVTNRQALWIQEALRELKIPSVQQTQASVFESEEAGEIARVLASIAQPGKEGLLKAALATHVFGFNAHELETLGLDESAWQLRMQSFHDYCARWNDDGFVRMFRHLMQREQVRSRLLKLPDGERRLTNVLHLSEVLHQAATEQRLSVEGLLKWLRERIQNATNGTDSGQTSEEDQLRLERDENAVKLVTIHRSKGLEYPIVFCPFSWNDSELKRRPNDEERVYFHDAANDFVYSRDLGPVIAEEHRAQASKERLAEIVRLLYVALTRARNRCYFVWGAFKQAGSSAPAWLLHQPKDLAGKFEPGWAAHLATLDDTALLSDLEKLTTKAHVAGGIDAIAVSDFPVEPGERFRPLALVASPPEAREFTGVVEHDWRITSFSSLTSGKRDELPDHDSVVEATPIVEAPASGMFEFPRGAKAGTCLHEIFEEIDFTAAATLAARELVEGRLRAHGFDVAKFSPIILETLRRTVTTPLVTGRKPFTLAEVSAEERLNEAEFYFPLKKISSAQLAEVFKTHGRSEIAERIPEEVDRLTFAPMRGFMKGFIDLLCRHDGRYHLLDWKTNWLGNRVEEYHAQAVQDEMLSQHYFLQYHLYVVAMNEYLRLRVRGYDYDRDFGGVYYLFLRGMDPARPRLGVFHDRPTRGLVDALSELLIDRREGGVE